MKEGLSWQRKQKMNQKILEKEAKDQILGVIDCPTENFYPEDNESLQRTMLLLHARHLLSVKIIATKLFLENHTDNLQYLNILKRFATNDKPGANVYVACSINVQFNFYYSLSQLIHAFIYLFIYCDICICTIYQGRYVKVNNSQDLPSKIIQPRSRYFLIIKNNVITVKL